jgi:small-conductance mechanosensitive channel/CRP-like cAMP-binding protein
VVFLWLATALIALAWAMPTMRLNLPLWLRAAWETVVFICLGILVAQFAVSPFHPRFIQLPSRLQFWARLLEAGWWLMAARCAIGFARLLVVLEHRPRETKIISDLLAATIYIAAFLAMVDVAFAIPIGGLVATSGIIAIVLGLALQSTLADVFSGIAVGLERSYRTGELVWVEGDIEGQILQVTWRSTQIATGNGNIAIIPNSVIAKAKIINRSRPTPVRGDSVAVKLDARTSPERCLEVLTAAICASRSLLAKPAASVVLDALAGDGNSYKISFSVATSSQLAAARSELLSEIHRHLRHGGIPFAVPGLAELPPLPIPGPSQMLANSDLFGSIEQTQREALAGHFEPVHLDPGETLIAEGGEPRAIYVIASGTVEITRHKPSGPQILHRMSPGESLGAVGLITGVPYGATATALTQVTAYRLDKQAIAEAIKVTPGLKQGLEALAKRGQTALRRDIAAAPNPENQRSDSLLPKLRSFLALLASR